MFLLQGFETFTEEKAKFEGIKQGYAKGIKDN
jgi:hypothetical protein